MAIGFSMEINRLTVSRLAWDNFGWFHTSSSQLSFGSNWPKLTKNQLNLSQSRPGTWSAAEFGSPMHFWSSNRIPILLEFCSRRKFGTFLFVTCPNSNSTSIKRLTKRIFQRTKCMGLQSVDFCHPKLNSANFALDRNLAISVSHFSRLTMIIRDVFTRETISHCNSRRIPSSVFFFFFLLKGKFGTFWGIRFRYLKCNLYHQEKERNVRSDSLCSHYVFYRRFNRFSAIEWQMCRVGGISTFAYVIFGFEMETMRNNEIICTM